MNVGEAFIHHEGLRHHSGIESIATVFKLVEPSKQKAALSLDSLKETCRHWSHKYPLLRCYVDLEKLDDAERKIQLGNWSFIDRDVLEQWSNVEYVESNSTDWQDLLIQDNVRQFEKTENAPIWRIKVLKSSDKSDEYTLIMTRLQTAATRSQWSPTFSTY